ncbi:MAG TPA: acetate/propionate family kinase [Candidatus Sulfopaludibacter sp.]|jgi:acetate kinase|nr:acetate/propionate family kinase [Candidatus Sulfopaludibacter sp.]
MRILVLNGGSSSLKATLRVVQSADTSPTAPVWEAHVDWGREPGKAEMRIGAKTQTLSIQSPAEVLAPVLATVPGPVDVVGHRVVHGGVAFRDTTRITPDVKEAIRKYCEFAPEHNRLELEAIEAAEAAFNGVPQIAVFDTAFHATIPEAARVYPGPWDWVEQGIRRYGFHGISHQYVSRRAARMTSCRRIVSCHLGSGASLAAIRDGASVDTTMGFTPLEGLMMGTRSGSVDPGILIYLVRHKGYDAAGLDRILNKESGLKGISGISGDMREVLAAMARGEARAQLAFDIYVHRLCREIGGMVASLGGFDALVFTAGIGENCPPLRAAVCERLSFWGIRLDGAKNTRTPVDAVISADDSAVRVLVVHTDEDWQIARECQKLEVG